MQRSPKPSGIEAPGSILWMIGVGTLCYFAGQIIKRLLGKACDMAVLQALSIIVLAGIILGTLLGAIMKRIP